MSCTIVESPSGWRRGGGEGAAAGGRGHGPGFAERAQVLLLRLATVLVLALRRCARAAAGDTALGGDDIVCHAGAAIVAWRSA